MVASAKAKKYKVKDEHLSWEEFSQASYWMLNSLKQQEWPEEQVEMIRDFWIVLESHDWRYDPSNSQKRALLVYQGFGEIDIRPWARQMLSVSSH